MDESEGSFPKDSDETAELLRKCAFGDEVACAILSDLILKSAWPIVKNLLRNDVDAQGDTVQTIWLAAYRAIVFEDKAPKAPALKTWIERIARRKCVDLVRRKQRERKHFQPLVNDEPAVDDMHSSSGYSVPGESASKLRLLNRLRAAITTFSGVDRLILDEICRGSTNEALGDMVAVSLATLKRHKTKLLRELRERFEEGDDDEFFE